MGYQVIWTVLRQVCRQRGKEILGRVTTSKPVNGIHMRAQASHRFRDGILMQQDPSGPVNACIYIHKGEGNSILCLNGTS